jgi:cyclic pyranopterin phosphate synthase
LLRGGASDQEVADAWRAAMRGKRAGHGIDDPSFLQPARPMSAIGG